jgi:hypothetical protein
MEELRKNADHKSRNNEKRMGIQSKQRAKNEKWVAARNDRDLARRSVGEHVKGVS